MNLRRSMLGSALLFALVQLPVWAGQPGENMAVGKKYTLSIAPQYSGCSDPDDAVQLTDGKTTDGYFWTQRGTVGWTNTSFIIITVDLDRIEPIGGVSFRTAAGSAGVYCPAVIRIHTSDDGQSYRDCGDLVALDQKAQGLWPEGYAIRRLSTSELRTRGRFVRFVVYPHKTFAFCDEVEIFRGEPALLEGPAGGTPAGDPGKMGAEYRTVSGMANRFEADIKAVGNAIKTAALIDPAVRDALRTQWEKAGTALRAAPPTCQSDFRAILPYNDAHASLFRVQAALWKAQGRADLTYCVPAVWDPSDLVALPQVGGQIEVHTMRGEYRAAAVNLANASPSPMTVRLRFDGLPDSPSPAYVAVHEVPWTDTEEQQPVAAALPLAERDGRDWRITVAPGLVRQIWFTFHVEQMPPGDYQGRLIVDGEANGSLQVPIRLRVYPLDFPRQTTLHQGGWDNTYVERSFGVTPQNWAAFVAHLQERFINAPWAGNDIMLSQRFAADGAVELDTRLMDKWIALWPRANAYYVFLNVADQRDFGGATQDAPEFDRNVGNWISAWVRHLDSKGIAPERLVLLIQDEPAEDSRLETSLAWIKAIHAAEPKVRIWEDPCYDDPAKAPAALFAACDVICPKRPAWLARDDAFRNFYRDLQRNGHTLHFYACEGPARLLDPYSYYRLQAWQCCQVGAKGSFFWALGDNAGASSWNEYLLSGQAYAPLFLDNTSVTAAKQMEAIREGAEDYEYFVMLQAAVAKAKQAGRVDEVLTRAESLLATAADDVLNAAGAAERRWHSPKDRTKADAVRVQVLEVLSALTPDGPVSQERP